MLVLEFTYTEQPIVAEDWSLNGLYYHRNGYVYKVCGTSTPRPYCRVYEVEDRIKNLTTGAVRWLVRKDWVQGAKLAVLVEPEQPKRAKVSRK